MSDHHLPGSPEGCQTPECMPDEAHRATTALLDSFAAPRSRRWLLRAAMAGTAATALASATAVHAEAVHAEAASGGDDLTEFFSILAT